MDSSTNVEERTKKRKKLHQRISDLRRTFTNYKTAQEEEHEQKVQTERQQFFIHVPRRTQGIDIVSYNHSETFHKQDMDYLVRVIQYQEQRIQALEKFVMEIYNKTIPYPRK